VEEQPIDEADRLIGPADQLGRETHEGDDLADARAIVQVQPGAERENRDQRDGRARARQHDQQRPPIEHRELRRDHLVHGGMQLAGFGSEPDEALDQHDVAERIAGTLGDRGMIRLDPGLRRMRPLEHEPGQQGDHDDQEDQQSREPPVQEQGERQEHEQGDEGREALAQEREPDAEQGVDALPHDLQLPARMRGAVEGVGQPQDVLEILAHRGQPTPLRQSVGVQGDQDARGDPADADPAPQAEEEKNLPPGLTARALAAAGQGVDDFPEHQRAKEAGGGERHIGQHQRGRERPLRRKQAHDAAIESQQVHRGHKSG
jgi:hypothetical protein